ncbi:protein DpdH [Actinokineospora pegani]|uniref:protein DpdH n=1 Tax=Actinokineospora pegani TaxID=2654637 RepID=UPI0012EA4303|nr:protein DpdH [Actinokineospora pegani]
MSGNLVCWNREAVDTATQVDVGGLQVDDAHADAVFAAIHQPLPLKRVRDVRQNQTSPATESDLLAEFTKPINANEPRLVFVTGPKGSGKSHLVRWLKSQIGPRPLWHVVYIEKRNTNLRRVIELILDGIDTPRAIQLRATLARASAEIASDAEAVNALLSRLDHLIQFDRSGALKGLDGVPEPEIKELRTTAHRLLGDFTFRQELSKQDGPIHRLVRLARGGAGASETDEADLHVTEGDLVVEASHFEDLGQEIQRLVKQVNSSRSLRADLAALCDSYLERAKGEVFTGPSTDLLEVFEDVRKEIHSRGKELCLFVEDLVLLHGIDKQLAQALTIPANRQLCRLRAAIAVTDGYLRSVDTFADRGSHFVIDVDMPEIGQSRLREFVGRYLNVGRLTATELAVEQQPATTANACLHCELRPRCHDAFGATPLGHGLYPFNAHAVDRLVELASPDEFRPRDILRHVIRDSLEVAEDELPRDGAFPSSAFARTLDSSRRAVPVDVRATVHRQNPSTAEPEVSLRAFYADTPPAVDGHLKKIAAYLRVALSDLPSDSGGDAAAEISLDASAIGPSTAPSRQKSAKPAVDKPAESTKRDEFQLWTDGVQLPSGTANKIRTWICNNIVTVLRGGEHGLLVAKTTKRSWRVGAHELRLTDVKIANAAGSGGIASDTPFPIAVTDDNALMLKGIAAASDGKPLDEVDGGVWYFAVQSRIGRYAERIAVLASRDAEARVAEAARALTVLRGSAARPGTSVVEALPAMLDPTPLAGANRALRDFATDTRPAHRICLSVLRDHMTGAKGAGKPIILDIGPIYRTIAQTLTTTTFAELEQKHGGEIFAGLQVRLARAADKGWSEVGNLTTDLAARLDPREDLAVAMSVIEQLVDRGHLAGKLPNQRAKQEYEDAASDVSPALMAVYQRAAAVPPGQRGPGALWELREDPVPGLIKLRAYLAAAEKIMSGVESKLPETHDGEASIDTELLIQEFKGLADQLDALAKRGARA